MNFWNELELSLSTLKEFAYTAKRNTFANDQIKKASMCDNTSVYSYRDFKNPVNKSLIYCDKYNGNSVEMGYETISYDLVNIWRNQYCGGICQDFFNPVPYDERQGMFEGVPSVHDLSIVTVMLRMALMEPPKDFPVRGPEYLETDAIDYKGFHIAGKWVYDNKWMPLTNAGEKDPFISYHGIERILYNDKIVFWHAYQGGMIFDKHFPIKLVD